MKRPERNEYAPYYEGYVSAIDETDIIGVLGKQTAELRSVVAGLPEEKGNFAYAEGKWTIKELIGHITDAERVFGYRLHRFSHGDTTPLSSFDQDIYVTNGRSNERSFADLLDEFEAARRANLLLASSLRESDWDLERHCKRCERYGPCPCLHNGRAMFAIMLTSCGSAISQLK
jgi:hypothetical protein